MPIDVKTILQGLSSGQPWAFVSVFFLLIFNEIGLPLPIVYESLLLFAGYQVARGQLHFIPIALFGLLGSTFGASLVFGVFYAFGGPILRLPFLDNHLGKIKTLKQELLRREIWAVTLARLTPGLIGLTGVAAGLLRLNYLKFVLGVMLSNLVWAVIVLSVGYFWGETSEFFSGWLGWFFGIFVLVVSALIFKHFLNKIKGIK